MQDMPAKKPYIPPKLVRLGTVSNLTLQNSLAGPGDGGTGTFMAMVGPS